MTTKAVVTSDNIDGTTLSLAAGKLVVNDTSKIPVSEKGAANGVASLGADGRVPSGQLPSYVDQILEYASFGALPAVGIHNVVYITLDTNKTYRWSGSVYVELVSSPGTTDSITEGMSNLYFSNARARAAITVSGGLIYSPVTGLLQGQNLSGYAPLASPTFTGTVGAASMGYTGNFTGSAGGTFALGTNQLIKDNNGNVGVGITPVANNGVLQLGGHSSIKALFENVVLIATIPTGSVDVKAGSVFYYTVTSSSVWNTNVRGDATTTLNSILGIGQSCAVTLITLQPASPLYLNEFSIDGVVQTVYWQGGTGPSGSHGVNVYSFVIIKIGSSAYVVLGAQANFS